MFYAPRLGLLSRYIVLVRLGLTGYSGNFETTRRGVWLVIMSPAKLEINRVDSLNSYTSKPYNQIN